MGSLLFLITQTALAERPSIWTQSHERPNKTGGSLGKFGINTGNIVQFKTKTAELMEVQKVAEPEVIKLVKEGAVQSEIIAE